MNGSMKEITSPRWFRLRTLKMIYQIPKSFITYNRNDNELPSNRDAVAWPADPGVFGRAQPRNIWPRHHHCLWLGQSHECHGPSRERLWPHTPSERVARKHPNFALWEDLGEKGNWGCTPIEAAPSCAWGHALIGPGAQGPRGPWAPETMHPCAHAGSTMVRKCPWASKPIYNYKARRVVANALDERFWGRQRVELWPIRRLMAHGSLDPCEHMCENREPAHVLASSNTPGGSKEYPPTRAHWMWSGKSASMVGYIPKRQGLTRAGDTPPTKAWPDPENHATDPTQPCSLWWCPTCSLYHDTKVAWYYSTMVLYYHGTTVEHGTIVPWYCTAMVLQ